MLQSHGKRSSASGIKYASNTTNGKMLSNEICMHVYTGITGIISGTSLTPKVVFWFGTLYYLKYNKRHTS